MRYRATLLAATVSLGLGGCFAPKKQLVLPPPPQVAAKPAPLPVPQIETPPELGVSLPEVALEAVTLETPPEMETPPPKPVPRKRTLPTQASTTPSPSTPATPDVEPPAAPPVTTVPQLSEMLTDDRRRQYEADFAASVARARAAVNGVSGRRLNERQKETVQRIHTFLEQAEEAKVKDLVTALQLARRADLLGQDLLKSPQ